VRVTIASVNRGPTHLKDPSLYLNAFSFQQVSFTLSDMPLRFFKILLKDATIHEPNIGAPPIPWKAAWQLCCRTSEKKTRSWGGAGGVSQERCKEQI
jgi:hypothetical protein